MTLSKLNKDLSKIPLISDKLDYLNKYHLKVKGTIIGNSGNRIRELLSIHQLAKKLSKEHFPELDDNVEFSLWFLKFNAQRYFKTYLLTNEFERKINSNRKEIYIENELKKLENELSTATQKELIGEINSSKRYRGSINKHSLFRDSRYLFDNEKYFYIEVLRMQEGNYYELHTTEHSYTTFESPEVEAYAKHIIFKEYLYKLSNKKKNKNTSSKLEMIHIALIYSYKGDHIHYENMSEIASEYGFTSPTSGNRLLQLYNKVQSTTDRKGSQGTRIKDKNRIEAIKKILPYLDEPSIIKKANEEISSLENTIY